MRSQNHQLSSFGPWCPAKILSVRRHSSTTERAGRKVCPVLSMIMMCKIVTVRVMATARSIS